MIRDVVRAGAVALAAIAATTDFASATTRFDGPWNLIFHTRRGDCDASYNFDIYIRNGVLMHPNLVRFKGRVGRGGQVRATVAVEDRYASGSGRLSASSGRGKWSGRSGRSRCSGTWVATRS